MLKALLLALLEPVDRLRDDERRGDFTARLALQEELKTLPAGAVWDYYCLQAGVPVGPTAWLEDVRRYESEVLSQRQ
jgi:L-rhamnose isomerase